MLMITFSPMSTRPSSVAEPICGSSTTLPALRADQLRIDRGLVLEHVEAGAGDLAGFEHAGQRVLVDHLAARGVDDIGRRLADQLQPPRRQQMIGRRRVRAIDRDDVHARQHLVEAFPIGRVQLVLDRAARRGGGCDNGSAGRRPRARRATAWPMRPMPMMPSRLPQMRWPSIQVGDQPVPVPALGAG